jgi:hypothetical protein
MRHCKQTPRVVVGGRVMTENRASAAAGSLERRVGHPRMVTGQRGEKRTQCWAIFGARQALVG